MLSLTANICVVVYCSLPNWRVKPKPIGWCFTSIRDCSFQSRPLATEPCCVSTEGLGCSHCSEWWVMRPINIEKEQTTSWLANNDRIEQHLYIQAKLLWSRELWTLPWIIEEVHAFSTANNASFSSLVLKYISKIFQESFDVFRFLSFQSVSPFISSAFSSRQLTRPPV